MTLSQRALLLIARATPSIIVQSGRATHSNRFDLSKQHQNSTASERQAPAAAAAAAAGSGADLLEIILQQRAQAFAPQSVVSTMRVGRMLKGYCTCGQMIECGELAESSENKLLVNFA
jgi:hypothetical protein